MKKIGLALAVAGALTLGACASTVQNIEGVFNTITTATVEPSYVNIALNTYYGLKSTAVGYGQYCIAQHFPRPTCSAANRRSVIQFVKAGDGAAAVLQQDLASGQPLLSTVYNTLVGAINGLKAAPITQTGG